MIQIRPLTSLQNPRVKDVVRLRQRRERERERLMIVEGREEIELALDSGQALATLFWCPAMADKKDPDRKFLARISAATSEVFEVTDAVFMKMSYREGPDGWLTVAPIASQTLSDLELGPKPLLLLTESVEKPGNLGAILRTAEAAGVDAVIVCDPATDVYNPNVIRASKGTVFAIPVVQASNQEALDWLRARGIAIAAATPHTDFAHWDADLSGPLAIAVGTENTGLSEHWLTQADRRILIPMYGKINSLNVAASAALLVYEAVRQRRTR